jgi:hypothetical protein
VIGLLGADPDDARVISTSLTTEKDRSGPQRLKSRPWGNSVEKSQYIRPITMLSLTKINKMTLFERLSTSYWLPRDDLAV